MDFLALPFPLLGHSLYRHLPLIQFVSFTGAYGLSFLVVFVNSTLAAAALLFFSRMNNSKAVSHRLPSKQGMIVMMTVSTVALGSALLYGGLELANPEIGERVKISVVQGNIELIADAPRILQILGRRAIAVVVLPVGHMQGMDVVAIIFQEQGSDCRVDTA